MKRASFNLMLLVFAAIGFCGQVVPPPAWDTTAEPGSDGLPLQYLGPGLPDRWAPDGHLMYSPGVQNVQISRANRKHPPDLSP